MRRRVTARARFEHVLALKTRAGGGLDANRAYVEEMLDLQVPRIARQVSARWLSRLLEPSLTVMAELEAIVADYLEQAAAWDVIPAAGCCPLLAEDREAKR